MDKKGHSITCLLMAVTLTLWAQEPRMSVFSPNFNSFHSFEQIDHPDLDRFSSEEVKDHPEYGMKPHNAQCDDCIELIQERDQYSRYFIKPETNGNHIFSQSSYTPLHFLDEDGNWISRDFRLLPTSEPRHFRADKQENPTGFHADELEAYIEVGPFSYSFCSKLGLSWTNSAGQTIEPLSIQTSNYTAGSHGILIPELLPGMDLRHWFKEASIETDLIMHQKPSIPTGAAYLAVSDTVSLYAGWTVSPMWNEGVINGDGLFSGRIKIRNEHGHPFYTYDRVKIYDSESKGGYGFYQVQQIDSTAIITWLCPVAYLNSADVVYPLVIDPLVSGRDSLGFFATNQAQVGANMDFTKSTLGSCDYTVTVRVPGHSEIYDTYIDLEYENPSVMCKVNPPPGTTPFCEFFDVTMEVVSPCGVSTGQLICNPANPPFLGTCTTDPNKVPGAGPIQLQQFVASFVNCIQPSCPDHNLTYTLKNRTLQCVETCDKNCAVGKFFAVTQEALRLEGQMSADRDPICAGEPVTLTATAQYGVPPYSYDWSDANGPLPDTGAVIVVRPQITGFYAVRIWDVCDSVFVDRDVIINVLPSPDVNLPDTIDICDGDVTDIGGSPTTTTPGVLYQWTAIPPAQLSSISNPNGPNPVFTPGAGNTGTFRYALRVTEAAGNRCFRDDTVTIVVHEDPEPRIIPDSIVAICEGEPATMQVASTYASYSWSNGGTTQSITVTQPGTYSVTVTDAAGCTGSSSSVSVVNQPSISFDVFPDTTVDLGSPVTMRSTLNLPRNDIDSIRWSPDTLISCTDCPNPIVSPAIPGYYTLTVYSNGCAFSDSAYIDLIFPEDYFIPNAFTPNSDGVNDVFTIYSAGGIRVVECLIYNRWGEKVFDGTTPWDGTYKGKLVPPGVYSYYFLLELFNGTGAKEKGSVTLIR